MGYSSKNPNPSSAYRRIEESLRNRIRQGQWPIGTMLPGRRDLAREYGVSLVTVERAVTHLLADGTLRSDNRRGTFVAGALPPKPTAEPIGPPVSTIAVIDSAITHQVTGRTRSVVRPATVGIIASLYLYRRDHLELNNSMVRTLLESIESSLSDHATHIRFYNRVVAEEQPLLSMQQSIGAALADSVDAIMMIALGTDPEIVDESLTVLDSHAIPIVCITSSQIRRPVPHVFYDNHSAGYQAAQHMLTGAHRNILILAPFTALWVQERIAGIQTAMEHAHLPAAALTVYPPISGPWINEEDPERLGYEVAKAAYAKGLVPSGVICVNDGVAFGFVQATAESGRKIGEDVALIGFDNHPRSLSLGITSLRAPMEEMGREAARFLVHEAQGEGNGFQVRLRSSLIARESTRGFAKPAQRSEGEI